MVADRRRAQAGPALRGRCEPDPLTALDVVAFVVLEGAAGTGDVAFAAQHYDQSTIFGHADARPRRRYRRCRGPSIGRRIVDVVQALVGVGAEEPATDRMNLPADHDQSDVVARLLQRRERAPLPSGGVANPLGCERDGVASPPAPARDRAPET